MNFCTRSCKCSVRACDRVTCAVVHEIATYRWALPADVQPLVRLLDALQAGRVDAVVFTSAVQIHNLIAFALSLGRSANLAGQMTDLVIASIGPVCSRALREHGIEPTFEADPPKLGPLMARLEEVLGQTATRQGVQR